MYIGLDLGTSGLKAIALSPDQTLLAEAHAPLAVSRPHDGWSEQDPRNWIAAAEQVLDELAAKRDLADLRAIGLAGQMHGATVLDAQGDVLRPCILWNDTRASAEAAELDATPAFRKTTGNVVFPGFTAPKLRWMQTHEPALFGRIAKVLLPKDYLRFWLTGDYVSEMSDASGTSWLDTGNRDWSDELLAATGLDRSHMPRLVEGAAAAGQVRSGLTRRWGMPADVIVAGGAGDNAAAAIGTGVSSPGEAFVSLGTSGVLFAATDSFSPDPATAVHSFCHALPQTWHQMGVVLAATDALNWYAAQVGQRPEALAAAVEQAADGALRPPGKALFLPYLGGERTPLNDAKIRAAFLGLEHGTDQVAATSAVLEGVAFALRDCREALASTGTELTSLIAVGGGSRSAYWLKILATVLGCPIKVPVAGDYGAAFGAARLAMMAAGESGPEILAPPDIGATIEPQTHLSAAFEAAYRRFKVAQKAIGDLS